MGRVTLGAGTKRRLSGRSALSMMDGAGPQGRPVQGRGELRDKPRRRRRQRTTHRGSPAERYASFADSVIVVPVSA